MESAREFAERYFNDPFKKKGCLEKMVETRDAAIRAECADRAERCFFTAMAESGLSTGNDYAVLVISDKIRAAIRGEEGR